MSDAQLIEWIDSKLRGNNYIVFPNEVFDEITTEQAVLISHTYQSRTLMRLPEYEIIFFEWLKENDRDVWDDLWSGGDEEPYIVGMAFLPALMDTNGRGFPICDLIKEANYYFTDAHLISNEAKLLVESVKARFLDNEKLTVEQLLALEISLSPIDIWHFAYKYKLKPQQAKQASAKLVEDKVLIHITEADKLADFVGM